MSHTTEIDGFSFIHNSDLSGEVEIVNVAAGLRCKIPGDALVRFMAAVLEQDDRVSRNSVLTPPEMAALLGLQFLDT